MSQAEKAKKCEMVYIKLGPRPGADEIIKCSKHWYQCGEHRRQLAWIQADKNRAQEYELLVIRFADQEDRLAQFEQGTLL